MQFELKYKFLEESYHIFTLFKVEFRISNSLQGDLNPYELPGLKLSKQLS